MIQAINVYITLYRFTQIAITICLILGSIAVSAMERAAIITQSPKKHLAKAKFHITYRKGAGGSIELIKLAPIINKKLDLILELLAAVEAHELRTNSHSPESEFLFHVNLKAQSADDVKFEIADFDLCLALFAHASFNLHCLEVSHAVAIKSAIVKKIFEQNCDFVVKIAQDHQETTLRLLDEGPEDKRLLIESLFELYFHAFNKIESAIKPDPMLTIIAYEAGILPIRPTNLTAFADRIYTLFSFFLNQKEGSQHVLEASHSICQHEGFSLLDVACLLSRHTSMHRLIHKHLKKQRQENPDLLTQEVNHATHYGTPLIFCISNRARAVVKELVHADADPCLSDAQGETPLMVAARHGHTKIALFLLKYGAATSINATNDKGMTALYKAVEGNATNIARTLITNNASTAVNYKLDPLLLLAIEHANPEIVQLLFEAGSDPNEQFEDISMLSSAIMRYGRETIQDPPDTILLEKARLTIQLFLEHPKIVANLKNSFGVSAIDTARSYDLHDIAEILVAQGAEENSAAIL